MKKKFISIIWWYHAQILSFDAKQNYHMLPIEVMKDEGYECEIFAIDARVRIEDDPNLIEWVKIYYYTNFFSYLYYLWKNRHALIYSNTLTIKTLLVGMVARQSVFMPHDQAVPLESKKLKRLVTLFFYRFFSSIRVINAWERELLGLHGIHSEILPISISESFYAKNNGNRDGYVFVGNLYADKNPEFLIETMSILEESWDKSILHIYGEDRYNKDSKNFVQVVEESWLESKITIHGFIPHKELAEELAKRMIYINTSISEGQCLTAYEAAYAGCSLCLQNILAFPSVFHERAHYHSTPEELANNILFILANPESENTSIEENQTMIRDEYNYTFLKEKMRRYFLSISA